MPGPRAPRTGNVFTASEKLGRDWKHFESCLDKHMQTHTHTHTKGHQADTPGLNLKPNKKYLIFLKQYSHHQSTAVNRGESAQLSQ